MGAVLASLGVLLLALLGAMLNGWVLQHLWAWFIVPVFAAPTIGVAQAIGITGVVGFLTMRHVHDERKPGEKIATGVVAPFFVLAFGWIVKQFL